MPNSGKIVILGGGMAGLSAAWRLSEGDWRSRFESITVYQRGWRLGGKAASSRGVNDRIEEHGLHVWLGSYENAFTLLRECYADLDRESRDPECPVRTWDQALAPAEDLGMADRWGAGWLLWPGKFSQNSELPGEPGATGRELTVVDFVRRTLTLILDFADSLSTSPGPRLMRWLTMIQTNVSASMESLSNHDSTLSIRDLLDHPLEAARRALDIEQRPDHRRLWLLLSLLTATTRGLIADNLISDPRGFRAINDEEYGQWLLRHGAHPDVLDFALIRGMYDMVFGYADGDCDRPSFAAGVGVLLNGIALFQYKGAFFWKMSAGMGDVVIAPLYQALRRRGVQFEFFHRVDALHLDKQQLAVDTITMGRQVALADGVDEYEPLSRARGLPVFPSTPLTEQLNVGQRDLSDLESHFSRRADAETRILRRGIDFDRIVLSASLGMVELISTELIDARTAWREMTENIKTVATQSIQLWMRPDEASLGWDRPGVTTSGYVAPLDTWASMPQTLWAENWPAGEGPRTVAYFCGVLDAPWPGAHESRNREELSEYLAEQRQRVIDTAVSYLDNHVGFYLPGAVANNGFRWDILCGTQGHIGAAALATQHVSVNIDPSDRYVQSVPASDKYRLRADESGFDNLVLAGDWTDSGINAGCIEAAVMSGLQAANALLGRSHFHRIRGFYMP